MQKEHRTDTEKDRQQSIKKGPEKMFSSPA